MTRLASCPSRDCGRLCVPRCSARKRSVSDTDRQIAVSGRLGVQNPCANPGRPDCLARWNPDTRASPPRARGRPPSARRSLTWRPLLAPRVRALQVTEPPADWRLSVRLPGTHQPPRQDGGLNGAALVAAPGSVVSPAWAVALPGKGYPAAYPVRDGGNAGGVLPATSPRHGEERVKHDGQDDEVEKELHERLLPLGGGHRNRCRCSRALEQRSRVRHLAQTGHCTSSSRRCRRRRCRREARSVLART